MDYVGGAPNPMRVSMLAPARDQCGISDYSARLIDALKAFTAVELVRCVSPPETERGQSHLSAIAMRGMAQARFRSVGTNLGSTPAQLAHIQHEFSLFGGVAPHRNHVAALYAAVALPVVITVHEIARESGGAVHRAAIRQANRMNFIHPAIRAWIVHTGADRDRLIDLGVEAGSVRVIPVAIPDPVAMPDASEARRLLGLEGKRVITIFGFLSSKKGHLDAMDALRTMPDNIVLVLAGDRHPEDRTDYVDHLRSEIERRKASNRIHITGFLPAAQLANVMAATDVAVAPYHYSSGSASVAHLLASGLPIVASDIPVFREIEDEFSGTLLLTPPHQPGLLAVALQSVLDAEGGRNLLRAAATRYAEKHTHKLMAQKTACVYAEVLGANQ